MSKPILEAKNIHKTYITPLKVSVLQGVSLTVYPQESVSITGISGSGKSTLLHILGTLETFKGSLSIHQTEVTKSTSTKLRLDNIGFVFQANNLLEELSLLDNILLKTKIARKSVQKDSEAYKEACILLEKVHLTDRMDFTVKLLSGGEKQRGSIARALMHRPTLIFADEPTGNLDLDSANKVQNLLLSCCKEEKTSLVVVTHDPKFADMCDTKYELKSGILTQRTNNFTEN